MEKLKIHPPPQPASTPTSADGYIKCPTCAKEYTRLCDGGLCPDCTDNRDTNIRLLAKQKLLIEACLGARGLREFNFESFKQSPENLEGFKACRDFNPLAHNLFLYGSCGSGKTHLAGAAWRKRVEDGMVCEFLKHPELPRLFRQKEADEEKILLKRFSEFDVLVIDDIGVGRATEFSNQILYEILDLRINNYKNGLILTSNLPLEDFAAKVGDDRLPSRIAGMCKVIKIGGKDHRLS